MNDCPAPALPNYEPPKKRIPAVMPKGMEKPHGIMNKVLGKILKVPKMNPLKMMSMKKVPKPFSKAKKKKIV